MVAVLKVYHKRVLTGFYLILLSFAGCIAEKEEDQIDLLILSGKNNHEWEKTTSQIGKIFNGAGLFKISTTEKPDTLSYRVLKEYDLILSNWNTWPDNDLRFPNKWENELLRYVIEGGGIMFFHAGASSFYGWNEFHQMGIGRWGKDTNHGEPVKAKVYEFDQTHPVTEGFKDFYIVDEIWVKTDIYPGVRTIASVTAQLQNGQIIDEPAMFVNNVGKGRTFFTILGHNERTLLNSGLQKIFLRAAQWCAGREVTIRQPSEFTRSQEKYNKYYDWSETDTSLVLRTGSNIVWQFNYNNRFGKPYFHPITINDALLTCVSPTDHPWHLGFWFSWKFINGINYWEFLDQFRSEQAGYRSEGSTEIQNVDLIKNEDYSADIKMDIVYHPANGEPVLAEKTKIYISHPSDDGSFLIDFDYDFFPLIDEVILDRTPVTGEPGGQTWGGYAGLSVRFNQDFTSPFLMAPDESNNYQKNRWLYMGFNTLTGDTAGICILTDPQFTTSVTSWYIINDAEIPFYYYSPAAIFDGSIRLKKGDHLRLKYRAWILPGHPQIDLLNSKYDSYISIDIE